MKDEIETNSIHGYFGIKKDKDMKAIGFCYVPTQQEAVEWLKSADENKADDSSEDPASPLSESSEKLNNAMKRAVNLTHGQSEMVVLACIMAPALHEKIIEDEIVGPMIASGISCYNEDIGEVYSIEKSPISWFIPAKERLDRANVGLAVLPQAAFMGIVSSFDSALSDIIRTMLRIKPDKLHQSAKNIALSDIISAKNVSDIVNKVIDDEIYTLFRGSHQEQVKYIESNFHIEISSSWKRWPDYIEIFERRNLVAHGEKYFTQRYIDICKENKHKGCEKLIGEDVQLKIAYMHQSLDVLLEFILLLIFSFWRKHLEIEIKELFSSISDIIYSLIENKRYTVAIRVAEYIISLKNSGATDAAIRVITVNLASAHLHMNDDASCKKTLNGLDWSACSDDYKICVAALNKDIDKFVELMASVHASNAVTKHSFKTWPVFDFVRSEEKVRRKFTDLYHEDISETKTTQISGSDLEAALPDHTEIDTVH